MRIITLVALLFITALSAPAQITVLQSHTRDTGWFDPGLNSCEPATWSERLDVPLPPDGTQVIRVSVLACSYRMTAEVVNLDAQNPLIYGVTGLYKWRVGHVGGLYGVGTLPHYPGESLRLIGHGEADATPWYVTQTAAGGTPRFFGIDAGGCSSESYVELYDTISVEIMPVTPEWMEPNRRGAKSLFVTATGEPTFQWYPNAGWTGSHSPWAYSLDEDVRATIGVEYGRY